jgi:Domain of unknown function (DUF4277)
MKAQVERLDPLGVIAGMIKDLKLIEFIDSRISLDAREEISCGEAVTSMIINGLGFSDRPLTLTPQFFENKALENLFRPDVKAESFNRFKLGRAHRIHNNKACTKEKSVLRLDKQRLEAVRGYSSYLVLIFSLCV